MLPAAEICERARLARDPRFDGRFVTAVLTTGIYCRPVCPARPPAPRNVRYFATAAAARDAGYRPCRRCRPEMAPRLPEWTIGSDKIIQALRLIDAGFLVDRDCAALAAELGVCGRHLNRLFRHELGASPKTVARTRRLHLAARLIRESTLSFADVAMQAGFGSVRRFNAEIKATYGSSPRQLRGLSGETSTDALTLRLPVREPYNHHWMFDYLAKRALAGYEEVRGGAYRRRLAHGGWLSVRRCADGLQVRIPAGAGETVDALLRRVRVVFDLDADPVAVDGHLEQDPLLQKWVRAMPGLRVPGAWDGFETSVRAILGQQVSVAQATRVAGGLERRLGSDGFPTPAFLVDADPAAFGMPVVRARAIVGLARAVVEGRVQLHEGSDANELREGLLSIPGIGPWTASYIGMRVARDPDAFPEGDWVVRRALGLSPAKARRRSVPWRPWRAYAVMYLWWAAGRDGL